MNRVLRLATILALSGAALPALAQQAPDPAVVPGQAFLAQWDLDGDGQVTLAEARSHRADIFSMFDSDGDGAADSAAALTALGFTDAERATLAGYAAGKSLWRALVTHLSTYDLNYGVVPAAGAASPQLPPLQTADGKKPDQQCHAAGSDIQCQSQILGESIAITGTSFSLHYASDRVAGRTTGNTLTIPLSGSSVPSVLKRIDLEIQVAGRTISRSFPATPNQSDTFVWDGKDAFGRALQGEQPVSIRVGYVYDGYYALPPDAARSFGAASGQAIPGNIQARQEVILWQVQSATVETRSVAAWPVGAWSLSLHHAYDVNGKILYEGDGGRRSVAGSASSAIIDTVAGNGTEGYSGDGGPATDASLNGPYGIAAAADGRLYIADQLNNRIRRVGLDGLITTVAGNGQAGFSGDGGPATDASLNSPYGIAVAADGRLYIADSWNHRIRRVGLDGVITTVAGNGMSWDIGSPMGDDRGGDGGPAVSTSLGFPTGVAVGIDGSLYILEYEDSHIRRVGLDGMITTVAGDGYWGFSADGSPAISARLMFYYPFQSVASASDGSLYFLDVRQIRRVGPDGILTTIVSPWNLFVDSGDGRPAMPSRWPSQPVGFAVGADGNLFVSDRESNRILRVGTDGINTLFAGNEQRGYSGDGGPPTAAALDGSALAGVAVGADGVLYFADRSRIRRVRTVFPGFSLQDILIPSADGAEVYHFDSSGRHLRTLDAKTQSVLYRFGYDAAGRLITITDLAGNVTTIERDAHGNPIAIVAPFGQRTQLSLDANGYLAAVDNPAGETFAMTYTADGLLTSFRDPRGHASTMTYDALGRLLRDQNADGGSQNLARAELPLGYEVTRTTAEGRGVRNRVETFATGSQQFTDTDTDGTQTVRFAGTDGTTRTTLPDGTVSTAIQGPDPRFGMQAPVVTSLTTVTGGLTATATANRTAVLSDPTNPLSLQTLTDTATLNGRTSRSVYDAATRTATATSAAGRVSTSTLDTLGRPHQSQVTGLLAVTNTYDAQGRLATLTQGTGSEARDLTFAYNPQGWLQSVIDPLGRSLGYEYDAAGRVTREVQPDGRAVHYGYDASGNLISLSPPGRPAHRFSYTQTDQTAEYAPPEVGAGTNSTLYTYNLDKDLIRIDRPDGQTLGFSYDSVGRLSGQSLPNGNLSYGYDATTGKLTSIADPDGGSLAFTYNGALLTDTAWTGAVAGNVGFGYDNDFRVTGISVDGADTVSYSYEADSLVTQAGSLALSHSPQNGLLTGTTLGRLNDSYAYTGFGETSVYEARIDSGALFKTDFTYDKLGRIVRKVETLGVVPSTYDYGYDLAGRLTEVKRNGAVTSTYTYDDNGNRLSRTQGASTVTGTYDDQDRLLTYGNAGYTYTANGELLTKTVGAQTTAYSYDVLGNLRQVNLPDGRTIDYVIDAANRRVGKKVNGTLVQGLLYQDQLKPIAELDGSGNIVSRFVYATHVNVPDYLVKGGVTYRIVTDHLGSPRYVVNTADGTIAQQMEYDEFGNVLSDSNPGFQPFGFAGGLYDRDIRLVRFGARDYDAETGRWLAKDVILFEGGDNDLYAYVGGEPVNLFDPTGRGPTGALIGAIIGGAAGLAIGGSAGTLVFAGGGTIAGSQIGLGGGIYVGAIIGNGIEDAMNIALNMGYYGVQSTSSTTPKYDATRRHPEDPCSKSRLKIEALLKENNIGAALTEFETAKTYNPPCRWIEGMKWRLKNLRGR